MLITYRDLKEKANGADFISFCVGIMALGYGVLACLASISLVVALFK